MQMWFLDGNRNWSIIKKWNSEHTLEIILVKEKKKEQQRRCVKETKEQEVFSYSDFRRIPKNYERRNIEWKMSYSRII